MAVPTNGVLDNFNRADGSVGANWSVAMADYPVPGILSNELNWPQYPSMYWNPTLFNADQESFVKCVTSIYNAKRGHLLRFTNPNSAVENGYHVLCTNGESCYASLNKIVAGDQTEIAYANWVMDPTDVWSWVTIIGSVIKLYGSADGITWTLRTTWTDTTFSGGGYIGLWSQNNGSGPFGRMDNFGGGNVVSVTLDNCLPDADITTTGWTTTPLYSKVNDASDATVIQATAV